MPLFQSTVPVFRQQAPVLKAACSAPVPRLLLCLKAGSVQAEAILQAASPLSVSASPQACFHAAFWGQIVFGIRKFFSLRRSGVSAPQERFFSFRQARERPPPAEFSQEPALTQGSRQALTAEKQGSYFQPAAAVRREFFSPSVRRLAAPTSSLYSGNR